MARVDLGRNGLKDLDICALFGRDARQMANCKVWDARKRFTRGSC